MGDSAVTLRQCCAGKEHWVQHGLSWLMARLSHSKTLTGELISPGLCPYT